jgi:hypothetical protein
MRSFTFTETPSRPAPVFVPDSVLDRLAKVSSGSVTMQLFRKGYRQPVMVGLKAIANSVQRFAGRAYTDRNRDPRAASMGIRLVN